MKRLLAALLLVAAPAFAQTNGWQEIQNGWGEIQTATGATSVPATCTTAGQIPFLGTPTTLGLGCDAGLTYDAGTDTLTTGIFKVGTGTDTSDPTFTSARTVSGTSGNAHAFSDTATVTRSGGIGYNSFNTGPTFSGTADFNHYNSFQAVATYSSSGTITNVFGATSDLNVTAGTVTGRTGFRFVDTYVTGGSVGTQVAFDAGNPTAATTNWAFYSGGAAASYHVGPLRLGGITTGGHRIGILGGTLLPGSTNKLLNTSMTFGSSGTTGAQIGILHTFTTAGNDGYQQQGEVLYMNAGYTGAATTLGATFINHAAGTASGFTNVGGGNFGIQLYCDGTTAGMNAGFFSQAANGTRSIGGVGMAVTTKNSGTNIGLVGIGLNAGSSPVQVGVYAGLTTAAAPGVPTTSAALIANNGATSDPIARFQVNGTDSVVIGATAGVMTISSLPEYADNTAAVGGGLTAGRLYRTSAGVLMVVLP